MFERFTERARRVLFFARFEASQLGSISIESEHLLLGLIREGKGLTSRIFARARINLEQIRKEFRSNRVPQKINQGRDSIQCRDEEDPSICRGRCRPAAAQLQQHRASAAWHPSRGAISGRVDPDGERIDSGGPSDQIAELLDEKAPAAVSEDSFHDLPRYLPSEIVHISFSRRQAVDATWSEGPRHWIMAGVELKSVIARAYGVDESRLNCRSRSGTGSATTLPWCCPRMEPPTRSLTSCSGRSRIVPVYGHPRVSAGRRVRGGHSPARFALRRRVTSLPPCALPSVPETA